MIVATAGHIDHGKTALVRALTGIDTDRLPEEKMRGISVDLGFAYRYLPDGSLLGFVDVPGHERFVRNMVAGVHAVDFALVVIAADDGVMPQTREHVDILGLLGVSRGAVVVTKIDRVDGAAVKAVAEEATALLERSTLRGAPMLPVSSVTGEGLEALVSLLESESRGNSARSSEGRAFRYAVDRAFAVAGSGTVVTGTVLAGEVTVGEVRLVSPAGIPARVRRIRIHDRDVDRAGPGERCAMNIVGVAAGEVGRGDWIVDPIIHCPTRRLDAHMTVLSTCRAPLKHWVPVHIHVGTAVAPGRIVVRRGESISCGTEDVVQILIDRPVVALHGDRFVVRDISGRSTIGGGRVLDPFPRANARWTEARQAHLVALQGASAPEVLAQLGELSDSHVDLEWFACAFGLQRQTLVELITAAGIVSLCSPPSVGIPKRRFRRLEMRFVDALKRFHEACPGEPGQRLSLLREAIAEDLPAPAFEDIARRMAAAGKVRIAASVVALASHDPLANPANRRLWLRVAPKLAGAGFETPRYPELAMRLQVNAQIIYDLLERKREAGEVVKVGRERFYLKATMAQLAALAERSARAAGGLLGAGQFRDAARINRQLAIEILECFDALGITRRIGDFRQLQADQGAILGDKHVRLPSAARANWRKRHRFPRKVAET